MKAEKITGISIEEKMRRKEAVDGANASMRLEGFILSEDEKELQERFINGEIDLDNLRELTMKSAKEYVKSIRER